MVLNILMLTAEFLPTMGGIGTYVVELSKRMPRDVHVHVVTPKPVLEDEINTVANLVEAHEFPPNVSIHHLGTIGSVFFGTFPFQVNCRTHFRNMVRDFEIDVVHSQSSMPDFLISPDREEVPIISTIHTTIEGHVKALRQAGEDFSELRTSERFALLLGPLLKTLEDKYYRSDRRFLTVSEWGKKEAMLEKKIDEERIRVAYNGIDTDTYNPDVAQTDWPALDSVRASGRPIILYLSRLATRKGIHVLTKAIPKVLKQVDCQFVIAGLGTPPQVKAPKDRVINLGYIPKHRIPQLYATSDIYVLPSFYENFPISVLEAMASECAVVTTRICGIPETIDHGVNGLMIRPGDVEALTESIVNLAMDEELRTSYGKMARQKVRSKFNWGRAAEITSDFYREVVAEWR